MNHPKILFVCHGNICRSPTAEAIMRYKVAQAGLEIDIDSAGVIDWHAGETPDPRSVQAGMDRGYDFKGQRSRGVNATDYYRFDHIFVMDARNLKDLHKRAPADHHHKIMRLLDNGQDVPDPYYGGEDGFETVLDLVEAACDRIIQDLQHTQM